MNHNFQNYLLKVTKASECKEVEVIQSLWSGYGNIVRYRLEGAEVSSVVVKHIATNQLKVHPRGWNTKFAHNRKINSYKIEVNWYHKWSHLCSVKAQIPKLIGLFSEDNEQWIVLEDLNTNYPLRKQQISLQEVKVCLRWLANFHATFMGKNPTTLWDVGTYWNLATRPEEFEKLTHSELKVKAHIIDEILNQCNYQTIVHGDAKLANFCFSEDGKKVAAVDFQYVGGGCGIKDVAYFLGSCLSSTECELYEEELLNFYFSELQKGCTSMIDFKNLEKEWRRMYPIACADFTRFLLGWMPSHHKVNKYNLKILEKVLSEL